MPKHFLPGGYPNPDPYYISPEDEAAMEADALRDRMIENEIDDEAVRQILATSDEDALAGNWPPLVKSRLRTD